MVSLEIPAKSGCGGTFFKGNLSFRKYLDKVKKEGLS
jgi:hypothetical protein